MYCGNTNLMQAQIRIENSFIYKCKNGTFEIKYPRVFQNLDNSTNFDNSTIKVIENIEERQKNSTDSSALPYERRLMVCGDDDLENREGIYCKNKTLFSAEEFFCNSTSIFKSSKSNKTIEILNCYKGKLPENEASFIPTTSTSTEATTTTTEKSLSIGAQMHIFVLKLLGKYEIFKKHKNQTEIQKVLPQWIPKALEILPEITTESTTTTTTPEPPFEWKMKIPARMRGINSNDYIYEEPPPGSVGVHYQIEKMRKRFRLTTTPTSWGLVKVYLTTTTQKSLFTSTETSSTTTTQDYSNSNEYYEF